MKKIKYLILIVIVGGLIYGADYFIARAPIFTGYAAKDLASWTFLTNRTQKDIEKHDLSFFPVNLSHNVIDYKKKEVTGTFLGLAKQVAVYREGLGCTLLADANINSVMKQKMTEPILPTDPQDLYWPMGSKMRDSVPPNVDLNKLNAAIDSAFNQGNTRAVVVAYDTVFLREKYAPGFNKNTRILGWSMSKSITSALIGILSGEGKLDVNAPAPIKEWANDSRHNIRLVDLLHQSSGLKWDENYGDISNVTIMLYRKGNMAQYVIHQPAEYPPDSVWYYSSGNSNVISEIIRRTIGNDQEYWNFPRKVLFNKIGMRSAVLETDASGNFVGSSYTFATPRDWARFGLLYLQDGTWQGKRILPEGWVKYSTTPARKSDNQYGVQFWLNKGTHEIKGHPDIYYCDGFHGQRVFIIPSKDLVIVRMGLNNHGEFDFNKFVTRIMAAFD